MTPRYIIRSNQYARISRIFYEQYLEVKKLYDSISKSETEFEKQIENLAFQYVYLEQMDDAAIAAVVFQALAVESYVNLWGIDVFGEKEYYDKTHKLERASTMRKLERIANELGKSIPEDLLCDIKALMEKRNHFVHQKPKAFEIGIEPYNYKNPEENFRDINAFIAEKMRAQENIEVDVVVYEKLQEAVRIIRGKGKELIDEFQEPLKKYVF